MTAISQTTSSDAFSWMKSCEFWLKFHWSLFLGVQLTTTEALFWIMVWCRMGDKPLSEPMLTDSLTHIRGTKGRWVNWTQSTHIQSNAPDYLCIHVVHWCVLLIFVWVYNVLIVQISYMCVCEYIRSMRRTDPITKQKEKWNCVHIHGIYCADDDVAMITTIIACHCFVSVGAS